MNDTHIQDIAYIDQPAELEGIQLNWSPSVFVKTRNGPRDLRTAPATPEFWEVWKRNKVDLKASGISCLRDPSGNWTVEWWIDVSNLRDVSDAADVTPVDVSDAADVTPVEDICIPEDKSYTISEFIDTVQLVLDKVREKSQDHNLQYSSTDVYWLLHDMLRYVNQNVSGMFVLRQIQKDTYRVKYMAEDFAKQKSDRKLKAEINRTAKYLEELTGRKPSWGEKE